MQTRQTLFFDLHEPPFPPREKKKKKRKRRKKKWRGGEKGGGNVYTAVCAFLFDRWLNLVTGRGRKIPHVSRIIQETRLGKVRFKKINPPGNIGDLYSLREISPCCSSRPTRQFFLFLTCSSPDLPRCFHSNPSSSFLLPLFKKIRHFFQILIFSYRNASK